MVSKMKLRKLILTLSGFAAIILNCILVSHLESRKPEIEIMRSITGVNIYNEKRTLADLLQFNYRTPTNYILTCSLQSDGNQTNITDYYQKCLENTGWKFTGESKNIDHSSNRKIGESFSFKKGIYKLELYFKTQDLYDYEKGGGKNLLKYSVVIYPEA